MHVSAVWPVLECQDWDGSWEAWPGSTQILGTVREPAWWEHNSTWLSLTLNKLYLDQNLYNFSFVFFFLLFILIGKISISHYLHQGYFLPVALSGGRGCNVDDVCPDRRPPSSILLLLHFAWSPNRPEGSSSTYCSVSASSGSPSPRAWHR